MTYDKGAEVPVNGPQVDDEAKLAPPIEQDPETLALVDLFKYCFFDNDGNPLLVDANGKRIKGPNVLSIGFGAFGANEAAAAAMALQDPNVVFEGIDPYGGIAQFAQEIHAETGGPGQVDFLDQDTHQHMLDLAGGKVVGLRYGKEYDAMLLRNPLGSQGALSTKYDMDSVVSLAEHINPGGLIAVTYTHAPSSDGSMGIEERNVDLLSRLLEEKGWERVPGKTGKRPHETISKHQSELVYPDDGAYVLRKPVTPRPSASAPAPSPAR